MTLRHLTDEEFLRRVHIELDALTSTDLEQELVRRFEEHIDGGEGNRALVKVLEDRGFDSPLDLEAALAKSAKFDDFDNGLELLEVLTEFGVDEAPALKKALERNAKFEDLLNDLADPIASLHSLITTTE